VRHAFYFSPTIPGKAVEKRATRLRHGAMTLRRANAMTAAATKPIDRPPGHDEPVYWFALLERALERGDVQAAAAAHRELRRLGVDVAYRLRPRRQGVQRAT
jgi:hypothetical protein